MSTTASVTVTTTSVVTTSAVAATTTLTTSQLSAHSTVPPVCTVLSSTSHSMLTTTCSSTIASHLNHTMSNDILNTSSIECIRLKSQEYTPGQLGHDPVSGPSFHNPVRAPANLILHGSFHTRGYDMDDVKPVDVWPTVMSISAKLTGTTEANVQSCTQSLQSHLNSTSNIVDTVTKEQKKSKLKKKQNGHLLSCSSSSSSSSSDSEHSTSVFSHSSDSDSKSSKKHTQCQRRHASIKLRSYDPATEDWVDYDYHARMVAKINHWDDKTLLQMVLASVTGQAKTIIGTFSSSKKKTYKLLSKAMKKFYNTTGNSSVAQAKLDKRARQNDESIDDLSLSIRELTMKVYRDCDQKTVSKIAVPYFLEALNDDRLHADVLRLPHATLEEATASAMQAEVAIAFEKKFLDC